MDPQRDMFWSHRPPVTCELVGSVYPDEAGVLVCPELPGGLQGHPPAVCAPCPAPPRVCALRSSPSPALDCIHFHRLPELDLGPSAQLGFRAQCALSQGWLQPSSSRGDAGLGLRASRQRDSNPVHPVHTRRGSRSSVVLLHPRLGESLHQSPQASFPTRDTVQGRSSASG